jgi:hypothetical protein
MKNNREILKGWPAMAGIACLFALTLSSCLKNPKNQQTTNKPIATMAVIDAAPSAPALDFYINSNVVNLSPITYGSGLAYFNTYSGSTIAGFFLTGTSQKFATDSVILTTNGFYSLFLANANATPDIILLADTINVPSSTTATVRFVNASANSPAVDFSIKKGSVLIGNKGYKGYSTFVAIPPSVNDTLVAYKAGTNTVLATLPGIAISTLNVYTVWLYGVAGATDNTKLNLGIMNNAAFN